ncbi:TPA: 2-dehydro-3-deoxy-6-phosphogalactonate aldolase [Klebsiella aerogenes]|uniref:2-dehydro-3-deoxy-6-phosphogalactonate aldolase n=1 Tax=Klebsiella aerogenes TaxID=548 RepID=UPI000B40AAD0|nr:2-dehydro-3-deoxy-6-phosphogalactonate aldolase [Klebsiella aerogenes]ELA2681521.1 2-dehydro-3-deoxy-6-phosphogalactonate aldolase [Klebsiella aerogenes]NPD52864.1 2-dehydro-3-deoxy-6-phosphogalactonate aldolase [Klebsiella aerogenes]NPD80003.1 2-dehydro-3-deoxy-6-phosphogalactonate aldolase [Klebsiella aerogenes]RNT26370.1 2-dehydro-3-deoxy-6-phosphogalactonate aldolase [Klebsiella aerogenes]HBT2490072.1 2-dehydro-3-deoxy-6-phosphogalactonate aldolase [Klebsiella aerogenes]
MNSRNPLVAILRGVKPDEVLSHIDALITAGFSTIEIPLNSPDWQRSIALAVEHYGHKIKIGAGTVTSVSEIDTLYSLGCAFILTPNTDPEVINAAREAKMTTCIGCHTASEAFSAIRHGATGLKIFPAGELGPDYIRALKPVLPAHVPLYAVGGIRPDNLPNYLKAGCFSAGLGSDLYRAGQSIIQTASNAKAFIEAYNASCQPGV